MINGSIFLKERTLIKLNQEVVNYVLPTHTQADPIQSNAIHVKTMNILVTNKCHSIINAIESIDLDEGASSCLPRPKCRKKDYQKYFVGCENSHEVTRLECPFQNMTNKRFV
jgi:hypothetical protein